MGRRLFKKGGIHERKKGASNKKRHQVKQKRGEGDWFVKTVMEKRGRGNIKGAGPL